MSCGHLTKTSLWCSSCLKVSYCSEECAQRDWSRGHDLVCIKGGVKRDLTTLDKLVHAARSAGAARLIRVNDLLEQRSAFPTELAKEISEYRTTKEDMEDQMSIRKIVFLSNLVEGPFIIHTKDATKGYTLVADKRYKGSMTRDGDLVTIYGGTIVSGDEKSNYVVALGTSKFLEGKYGFVLREKGRWINENRVSPNVYMKRNEIRVLSSELERGSLEQGEEILLDYGDEYERSWEPRENDDK